MKKFLFPLLMLLFTAFAAFSQKTPNAEELAKKNVEELEKRLKLSTTQRSVVYNYAYDLAKEQLDLYKKQVAGTFVRDDETRYFKKQNEINNLIRAVLKGDQVTEFNQILEERLSGVDPNKKKKKARKGQEEDKVVGIEGLKSTGNL